MPVVRRLLVSELASDGMVAVLGDAGGRLLWIEGHHGVRSALEDAGFAEGTVWTEGGCASWYQDARGRNTTLWPDFTFLYRRRVRAFDEESYETTPAVANEPERETVGV